jgi:hypothetical protein
LDIGSATGFFSFEFAKRGANVTSVELPSIADWDMLPGEDKEHLKGLMAKHQVSTVEEVQYLHLDGPFEFCRKVLNSKVRRCHSTIYNLSPEKLGKDAFDWFLSATCCLIHFLLCRHWLPLLPFARGP